MTFAPPTSASSTAPRLQVAVVGDISAAELGPLLDKVFGGLPKQSRRARLCRPPRCNQDRSCKVIDRDIPQSVIVFGTEGITARRIRTSFRPMSCREILGGGSFNSRLTDEVREKRGLTYGVGYGLSPMERAGLYVGVLQTAQ